MHLVGSSETTWMVHRITLFLKFVHGVIEFWGLNIYKILKLIHVEFYPQNVMFFYIVKIIMPSTTVLLDDGKVLPTF